MQEGNYQLPDRCVHWTKDRQTSGLPGSPHPTAPSMDKLQKHLHLGRWRRERRVDEFGELR